MRPNGVEEAECHNSDILPACVFRQNTFTVLCHGDAVLGRGVVPRLTVSLCKSSVVAPSSLSLSSLLLRLFGQSPGVKHSQSHVSKGRFLLSTGSSSPSPAILPSPPESVSFSSPSLSLISPNSQSLYVPSRLFAVICCSMISLSSRTSS
jgi:hypothetical protein